MGDRMKLYIWHEVLCDYTCGIAFATAKSLAEARDAVIRSAKGDWRIESYARAVSGEPEVIELDKPFGHAIGGGG